MMFTMAWGGGYPGNDLNVAFVRLYNGLYDGFVNNNPLTCDEFGYQFGVIFSEALDYRVASSVYFTEVMKFSN